MVEQDGSTADQIAGIRTEFESPTFYFVNNNYDLAETNKTKKQIVAGRKGTNWELTADTGSGPGKLFAEYILDGQSIKVGNGDAVRAGTAFSQDLVSAQRLISTSRSVILTLSDWLVSVERGWD